MKILILSVAVAIFLAFIINLMINKKTSENDDPDKIVIAHRAASAYLPEHSSQSVAMAYAFGVDYIEQDVVMTKDNVLIVIHDLFLDGVSNVEDVFSSRKRDDGRYYAIDFTLDEIRQLEFYDAFKKNSSNKKELVYKNRFPLNKSRFQVMTFTEAIELIQGLNHTTGNNVGLYVEIKMPWFHKQNGKDIALATLQVLKKYGYTSKNDKVYLESFDPNDMMRIKKNLMPRLGMDLKLVQLLGETSWNEVYEEKDDTLVPYDWDWIFNEDGIKKISEYADGIGPWVGMLKKDIDSEHVYPEMIKQAQKLGMKVHPYTFRADALPPYAKNFNELLDIFFKDLGVDGVFTDHPDKALKHLKRL